MIAHGAERAMLEARGLELSLPDFSRKPPFGKPPKVDILKGIDLALAPGEAVGLVGESGSGKTSFGRTLVRLYEPTGGTIRFEGRDLTHLNEAAIRPLRPRFQMIFQDPQSSLNPRHRVGDIVAEPLIAYERVAGRAEGRRKAAALLERVTLDPALATRYPHELSGGQRQRVGIARAIALDPAFVVADEIVSGLDVSSQAQILALLRELRADLKLALIFISHDLSVVRTVCDRVMVMLEGRVVEEGPCAEIFAAPKHPYTAKLLDAIPLPDVDPGWIERTRIEDMGTGEAEQKELIPMKIDGCVALVTGANRGIGEAYVKALKARGAKKIYAAVRDTKSMTSDDTVEVVKLDVTKAADIDAAAKYCKDVTLLINNAGVNYNTPLVGHPDTANAEAEMETNYFGTLNMVRAFAPVLRANGGGVIVNMLSITGRVNLPLMGSLSVSKAAGISMTQGVRAELAGQGTQVIAVMPGAIDTRMTADFPGPKAMPDEVVKEVLDGLEKGEEDIYPGDMAKGVIAAFKEDMKAIEKEFAKMLPQ
jgi:ABC-type oligopeptide transport system ATPase subunit/NAD(P)-dependent dehydrogenase (short-subunit alcohol dehydrogenase family)